jgi:hypothetical protein
MDTEERLHASAIRRLIRAREREHFARRRQAQAWQEAAEASTREARSHFQQEADMHGRAAELHHQAVTVQSEHARAHADGADGGDPRSGQS